MKKTLLLSALAFTVLANAQKSENVSTKNHFSQQATYGVTKQSNSTQAAFWTDDFSSASTWTRTATAGTGLWSIGTTGATGGFSITTINSTTKANGFAIFDSDVDCSGNEIANLTNVTAINCTGHSAVRLEFQQQYRRFSDSTFVFVSNNGTTWTKFPVNKTLKNNDFCVGNPELVKVNITSVAANQATVWIRFQFYSPSSLAANAGCGYSWMIDDAALADIAPNDMQFEKAIADVNSTVPSTDFGGLYTMMPKTQVLPVTFGAILSNQGAASQTNVKFNVSISNGSNVYNQTSTVVPTSAVGHIDTLFINSPTFIPSATQTTTYTMTYSLSQTETELAAEMTNNSKQIKLTVNDTIFARDNGVASDIVSSGFFVDGDTDGSEIGNTFQFSNDATANSISAFVASSTTDGTSITAKIHKLSPNGDVLELTNSNTILISGAANKNKWYTLKVNQLLMKDSVYIASIMQSGITTSASVVVIGADDQTFQRSGATWLNIVSGTNQGWFTIKELPLIRLNIKSGFVGIEELTTKGFSLEQNSPNPFSNSSTVSYELAKDARNVSFSVIDITGRVISSEKVSSTLGKHSISLTKYAAGVYYYSLTVDGVSTTKKMIVE